MNLEEIRKFPETFNLLKWSYKEIENLSKSIMNKEIRLVLKKNLPNNNKNVQDHVVSLVNSTKLLQLPHI